MGKLTEPDRGRIAVTGNTEIDQIAVGEIGAREHTRHAAMHGIEAVALAEKVIRRLRGAADTGKLGNAVWLEVELVAGLDECRAYRIVPASCAERGDATLVIAVGETDLVELEPGVMKLGLGDIGHVLLILRLPSCAAC